MRRLLVYFLSHRTLALIRWDLHFLRVRFTNVVSLRGLRLAGRIARARPIFLNLGSGPRGIASEDWINVDGWTDHNVHLAIDLNRPLPFADSYFAGIFCEHVFEHFDLEQGQSLLRECFRVLKPGGCLRLIVPDGETIIRTYLENPAELTARRGNGSAFAIDAVNSYFRQRYEHQYIYDWPMLENQFSGAGFAEVRRVGYQEGAASKQIMLDDEKYAWESLYVEAVKPGRMSGVT
jgi:predicted SAM-dependent methyltransferase